MTLQVSQEGLPQLWEEWEGLIANYSQATVFQTPLWHDVWWQEFGGAAELRLITVRDDGVLVGIAPFMYQNGALMFVGDTDLWDYHAPIIVDGREDCFYSALFGYLEQQEWTRMDLRSLPQTSPVADRFMDMAKSRGYKVELIPEDVSPGLALPSSWEDYLALLSKKDRHELRRKLRRLERQDSYSWYSVNGAASLEGTLTDFFNLMRDSRQDKAMFLTSQRERFFKQMVDKLARSNVVKLFFMEISGERVASALCFDFGNVRYLYNSGFNPDYSSLSVGLLLKAMCIRQAIEEGMTYFDFLRGDEPYKYDLGAKDVPLFALVVQR